MSVGDDGFSELANLKKRLESLGVKIKSGVSEAGSERVSASQAHVDRDDVNRLLERCAHVEAALNTCATDQESGSAPNRQMTVTPVSEPFCRSQSISSPKRNAGKRITKKAFVPTVRSSVNVSGRNRASPIASLLADYKDAEAKWNHEKAELRRQLAAERKRTIRLEAAQSKLQSLCESKAMDLKAMRTALSNREEQLKALTQQRKELEELHATRLETMAQDLSSATLNPGERDDVKALLVATLQRLEAVDRVVQEADESNASLEERLALLEEERNKAVDCASTAQARVEALQKSQRRIEWQNKMLDRISEVQMAHNRSKAAAMHELLDKSGALMTDQASTIAETCTDDL